MNWLDLGQSAIIQQWWETGRSFRVREDEGKAGKERVKRNGRDIFRAVFLYVFRVIGSNRARNNKIGFFFFASNYIFPCHSALL